MGDFDTRALEDSVCDTLADIDSLFVNDCVGLDVVVEVKLGLHEFIGAGEFEVEGDAV